MDRKSLLFAGAILFGLSCNGGAEGCGGASGTGCSGDNTGNCESCLPNRAYRCPVQSTNNIICAADDAHALAICPEGPTPLDCGGGSGGQGAKTPDAKAPDAKLDSKSK